MNFSDDFIVVVVIRGLRQQFDCLCKRQFLCLVEENTVVLLTKQFGKLDHFFIVDNLVCHNKVIDYASQSYALVFPQIFNATVHIFYVLILFIINRFISAMMSTGDVISSSHPQSLIERGDTLNISLPKVTIIICPTKITNAIYIKLGLKDVFTSSSFLNTPHISCIKLREVLKYFALNRFQN